MVWDKYSLLLELVPLGQELGLKGEIRRTSLASKAVNLLEDIRLRTYRAQGGDLQDIPP